MAIMFRSSGQRKKKNVKNLGKKGFAVRMEWVKPVLDFSRHFYTVHMFRNFLNNS